MEVILTKFKKEKSPCKTGCENARNSVCNQLGVGYGVAERYETKFSAVSYECSRAQELYGPARVALFVNNEEFDALGYLSRRGLFCFDEDGNYTPHTMKSDSIQQFRN